MEERAEKDSGWGKSNSSSFNYSRLRFSILLWFDPFRACKRLGCVFLSACSAYHDGLDLAYAFYFCELGFEFVDDACFVFGESYLDEECF